MLYCGVVYNITMSFREQVLKCYYTNKMGGYQKWLNAFITYIYVVVTKFRWSITKVLCIKLNCNDNEAVRMNYALYCCMQPMWILNTGFLVCYVRKYNSLCKENVSYGMLPLKVYCTFPQCNVNKRSHSKNTIKNVNGRSNVSQSQQTNCTHCLPRILCVYTYSVAQK